VSRDFADAKIVSVVTLLFLEKLPAGTETQTMMTIEITDRLFFQKPRLIATFYYFSSATLPSYIPQTLHSSAPCNSYSNIDNEFSPRIAKFHHQIAKFK